MIPVMKNAIKLSLLLGLFNIAHGGEPQFKTVLFQDDFAGTELNKTWGSWKSATVVKDGVMVGITPEDADHPSVNQIKLEPQTDLEVAVDFKFAGSNRFSVMFRDLDYKGSHAGHICHVAVSDKSVQIHDGKTGIFVKEIRDKRKAGEKLSPDTLAMLKTKSTSIPVDLDTAAWHNLLIRIVGDILTVSIDGKEIGSLKSEGIAHPTKSNMNITTTKREVHYDNFSIKAP